MLAADVPARLRAGRGARLDDQIAPRFSPGDRVRARNRLVERVGSIVGGMEDDVREAEADATTIRNDYGNSDLMGPEAKHGTHVAGIIGAIRGNGLGIEGIAPDVKLMMIRTVPDGDERDKDVANAIRYATENGAQIIDVNMDE